MIDEPLPCRRLERINAWTFQAVVVAAVAVVIGSAVYFNLRLANDYFLAAACITSGPCLFFAILFEELLCIPFFLAFFLLFIAQWMVVWYLGVCAITGRLPIRFAWYVGIVVALFIVSGSFVFVLIAMLRNL